MFRRLQNPDTAASLAYFMYPLQNARAVNSGEMPLAALGVRAVDSHILELTLDLPYPHLPERLLYPTAFPVPRHVINSGKRQRRMKVVKRIKTELLGHLLSPNFSHFAKPITHINADQLHA